MNLITLLKNISITQIIGTTDITISRITQDSRDTDFSGGLYFAVIGTQLDGHIFIDEAIGKGAHCIVCSTLPRELKTDVTYVLVKNVTEIIGQIASAFYDNPSQKIKVIAVTGTNGKTSVATFISQSLSHLDKNNILLSTAGDYYNNKRININRKAPSSLEIIELHKVLGEYVDQGAEYCILEATSQALDQKRLSGVHIHRALFTNLAEDHLDYHGTMNKYADAKKLLFDNLESDAVAIVNIDDNYGKYMINDTCAVIKTVSQQQGDYVFAVQQMSISGMDLVVNDTLMTIPLVGEFNAYNASMTYACLETFGFNFLEIKLAMERIKGIPGRMQSVPNTMNMLILVDYAHSSDALDNVLRTLKNIPHNNIISVVGCGGDRDTTKRAPMAKITQTLSDHSIFTADNPRTENIQNIFNDMKLGLSLKENNYEFIASRETAIQTAIQFAQPADIILIAGKGHEDYQIIGTEKRHFDDVEMVQKYVK